MSTRRMVIIQPENKTLLVNNISGISVNLDNVSDVVRGNASQPSNGELLYLFTSTTEVSVNGESSVSVTTDGSTYNDDVGGKGVDIIFRADRSAGEMVRVEVVAGAEGRDTYLNNLDQNQTHGGCDNIIATNFQPISNSLHKVTLIHFDVPSIIKNILRVNEAVMMLYKDSIEGTPSPKFLQVYAIMPANGDWLPGPECDFFKGGYSSWTRKFDVDSGPSINWASGLGGCQVLGTDVEPTLLSFPEIGIAGSWLIFTSENDSLNSFADRMIKSPISNSGVMIRTRNSGTIAAGAIFHSSEYTADITLRPKMLILYDEPGSGLDGGVFPNYPTSMGSETPFGGFGSTVLAANQYLDESREAPRADMRISDDEINDDFGRDSLGGQ